MQIFNVLHQHCRKVVYKKQIIGDVWENVNVTSKTLDVHIHNLRNKIEPLGLIIQSSGAGKYLLMPIHN